MLFFVTLLTLFVIGSLVGWIGEVLFRRIFSQKKWVNPGFLVGPYLPLYGFGTIALYLLSNVDLSFIGIDNLSPLGIIIKILFIGVSLTIIEFIAGLIFIKGMNLKLWDYSKRKGNIMGIICPLFSLLWLIAGSIYYFFINPYLVYAIKWLEEVSNNIYYFFIGIVVGMMITDFAYSMHIATKISSLAKKSKIIIDLEKLKEKIKEKSIKSIETINTKLKAKKPFFFIYKNNEKDVKESVLELMDNKEVKENEDKKVDN
ncbi:MAG: putative ABC transporter permease [Bacilli bacterium]